VLEIAAAALLSGAAAYAALRYYPKLVRKRMADEMEAELPAALRGIGVELNISTPFEQALGRAARGGGGPLARELAAAVREIEAGAGIQDALKALAGRADSVMVKRACAQLVACYEHGERGEGLKRLAGEMMQVQRARAREFAARSSMLGLVFIAVSCVLPALFLALVVVGSSFMGALFTPLQVWLAFLAAFPLLDAALIAAMALLSPAHLRAGGGARVFSEREVRHVNAALRARGIGADVRAAAAPAFLASGGAAAVAHLAMGGYGVDGAPAYAVSLLIFSSPLLAYFYFAHLARQRGAVMERFLPDALFQAASLQRGAEFERLIASIARSGYGPLSEEFSIVQRQVRAGVGVAPAVRAVAQRADSVLVERAASLLLQAYATGADMCGAMREAAEDTFEVFSALTERRAALAMQRYTLLFGALLVPLILGLIVNVVSGLDFSPMDEFAKAGAEDRAALLSAGTGASQAYLALFALLSSLLIAQQEGDWRKAILYSAALVPASLALFAAARAFGLGM